jgi:hypothetical protein
MAYPAETGYPQLSGVMIPQIWSPKLLIKFYDNTLLSDITNTDYEGEIKKSGDEVIIRTTPSITIRDYKKGQTITFENPTPEKVSLLIDKGKYFGFTLDSVDIAQMDIAGVEAWTQDASMQMKIEIETGILGAAYIDADAKNAGETAGRKSGNVDLGSTSNPLTAISGTTSADNVNALEILTRAATCLDEQNVPQDSSRFFTAPASFMYKLMLTNIGDASWTGDAKTPLRTGMIGRLAGFNLFSTNLLAKPAAYTHMLYGHKAGLTFATQLVESDQQKNPNGFGILVKGLQVYGWKTIKPAAVGNVVCIA